MPKLFSADYKLLTYESEIHPVHKSAICAQGLQSLFVQFLVNWFSQPRKAYDDSENSYAEENNCYS